MLRVGLTGGLGSGKSTVAAMLRKHGAHVVEADALAREMMRPGEAVYAAIVACFGPGVVRGDGELDRAELARLAFAGGRVEELNAIVHPAVIARQAEIAGEMEKRSPGAVFVVESALIFETRFGGEKAGAAAGRDRGAWKERFDCLVLITAPEEVRIDRFVRRSLVGRDLEKEDVLAAEADARRRLRRQMPDGEKARFCDYVLRNDGSLPELERKVEELWPRLVGRVG